MYSTCDSDIVEAKLKNTTKEKKTAGHSLPS